LPQREPPGSLSHGSASDHLANERTFLAYLRTALAFIGFGFVIARFAVFLRQFAEVEHRTLPSPETSTRFGVATVALGVAIALFGFCRYVSVMRSLAEGRPVFLSAKAAGVTVLLLALFGAVLAYVLFRVPRLE
jgi:putative membrane protein